MPRLKIPNSEIAARSSTPSGYTPGARASQADFARGSPEIGGAMQAVGAQTRALGGVVDDVNRRKRIEREEEELANTNAQADPTPAILDAQAGANPDGSDLHDRTRKAYQDWIVDTANGIDDGNVRSAFRRHWLGKAPSVMAKAAVKADSMALEHSRNQLSTSLSSLENRVRIDPSAYDDAHKLGLDAIATQPRLATEAVRRAWTDTLARARFEASIENASTPAELDNVQAELASGTWQKLMGPNNFDNTVDELNARRSSLRTAASSAARAYVQDVESRTRDLHEISREEITAVAGQVRASGDPVLQERLSRAERDQALLRIHGQKGPDELKAMASASRSGVPTVKHEVLASAIDEAVAGARGGVTAGYLASVAHMEFGAALQEENPDFGAKHGEGGTSAGVYGFTDGTWLSVVRSGGDAILPGQEDMSTEEVLAARADVSVASRAAVALTEENSAYLSRVLGRKPEDFELYMAHFLGATGAASFLRAHEKDERTLFADVLPAAGAANKFTHGKTLGEVYDTLSSRFSAAPGRVSTGDAEYLESMAKTAVSRINENAMGYAAEKGIVSLIPLNAEGGASSRATAARIVSSTWHIPLNEVQPLEPGEVAHYKNILTGEDPDAKTEVMALFSEMGPVLSQAAYKQMGVDGNVYAHGAALLSAGGQPSAAYDIVRGQTFIDNNPDFLKASGLERQQILDEFGGKLRALTGGMGSDAATGGAWQTVLDAAVAHYVQTASRRGVQGFDGGAFERSLNYVLGGTDRAPAIHEFNGELTVLPNGVSPAAFDQWVYYARDDDWLKASVRGLPPRFGNGQVVDSLTLQSEASFEPVGAGRYRVKVDGSYLTTGRDVAPGMPELWVISLDKDSMASSVTGNKGRVTTEVLSDDAQAYLKDTYGFAWGYDSNGKRVTPEELKRRKAEAIKATAK